MFLVALLFVTLLVAGVALGELEWRAILCFLLVAAGGLAAFIVFRWPPMWYTVVLAGLDVVLVLWVFKGNLTIR
jgi:hypothetical protein